MDSRMRSCMRKAFCQGQLSDDFDEYGQALFQSMHEEKSRPWDCPSCVNSPK
jgi:hypothetical protein